MANNSSRAMTSVEWTMIFILSLLWGSSFLLIKYALKGFAPFTTVLVRVLIAAVMLMTIITIQGKKLPKDRKIWRDFLVISLLTNVIPFSLIMWAETHITSGLASVLNASAPLWTVILALSLRTEHITWNRILGVLFGFTGVAVMIGMNSLEGLGMNILAQLGMLVATLCYAVGGNFTQRVKHIDSTVIATGQVISSSIVMIPIVLLFDKPWLRPAPPAISWGAVAILGMFGTAIAYVIYFRLLTTVGTSNALLVTFLIPINAVLLGILVLHETFAPYQFIGMTLILLGLVAIDGRVFELLKTKEKPTLISE